MKVPSPVQFPALWPLAILALAVCCPPPPLTGAASPLLASYNARPIGSPGLRWLELQLKSGANVTRRFEVVHTWRRDGPGTRSLVFLESPAELRGTSYLWVEGDAAPGGLQVFLRLPAGMRRVLSITPSRFDEGLLGSDFAYSDLLWQIPTSGRRLRPSGRSVLDGVDVQVLESQPASAANVLGTSWKRIRYFLTPDGRTLRGADYYDKTLEEDPGRAPTKGLRTFGWAEHDGILVPSRMVMSAGANRSSELVLKTMQLEVPGLARELFEPGALGDLADGFEQGTPDPIFRERSR